MAGGFDRLKAGIEKVHNLADEFGSTLVGAFHLMALFAIGATIVYAAGFEFFKIISKGHISVEDILLLFIYLELGAMVGIYFNTNHMPVRFLMYIALTALTRLLIGMVNLEHVDLIDAIKNPHVGLMVVTGCIILLTFGVLILRFASFHYPSKPSDDAGRLSAKS
ncbi:MAG: phosphate-starvation-inducible protein PsiE [Hyphomicrobiales bacterium]